MTDTDQAWYLEQKAAFEQWARDKPCGTGPDITPTDVPHCNYFYSATEAHLLTWLGSAARYRE